MASAGELHSNALPLTPGLPNLNVSYEPDLESFLNLDQLTPSEPAKSNPSIPSQPSRNVSDSSSNESSYAASQSQSTPFSGPSHQYGDHQQQTGLPPGAVAHGMVFNDSLNSFGTGSQAYTLGGDMFSSVVGFKQEESPIDFGSVPAKSSSEMDAEPDGSTGLSGFYFPSDGNKLQFVDPTALGGQDVSPVPPTQIGRVYPGVHQQAAMARAAAQRQAEMMRQAQRHQQDQTRQTVPPPQSTQPATRSGRNIDPVVEEKISRILQQMRQNNRNTTTATTANSSTNGSNNNNNNNNNTSMNNTNNQSGATKQEGSGSSRPVISLPQPTRKQKDESEMDEDERLLASEEGKKLSSKERRQLRNKVSARAFRSRRKEYIAQLENEVANKANEVNDLRMQNQALMEENSRLTDLTRMLLSSPHFSSFLNDMAAKAAQQQQQEQQQQQQQQQVIAPSTSQSMVQPAMQSNPPAKDANTHLQNAQELQGQPQQHFQVGMVMVPEQGINMREIPGWNSGLDMSFMNTPVFALLDVPEGPAVDTEALSGKTSRVVEPLSSLDESKSDVPCLERPPAAELTKTIQCGTANPNVNLDESDSPYAFFADEVPAIERPSVPSDMCGGIKPEKALLHYQLIVEGESTKVSAEILRRRFELLCASMNAAFDRVSRITSHLE